MAGAVWIVGCGGGGGDGNSPYAKSIGRMAKLDAALLIYMNDYDDVIAPANRWVDGMIPYAKDVTVFNSPVVKTGYGYALNSAIAGHTGTEFPQPSTVISFFDSTDVAKNATELTSTMPSPPRYGQKNTIGYLDGEVQDQPISTTFSASAANLKQVSSGLLMYANDWDDVAPLGDGWMDVLGLYVKRPTYFHSPAVFKKDQNAYGYAMNMEITGQRLGSFSQPWSEISLFDSTVLTRSAVTSTSTLPNPPRYGKYNTIAYLDGHIGNDPTLDPYKTSQTNLKQLALGTLMYAGDYDDVGPLPHAWMDELLPYVKNPNLFHSPAVWKYEDPNVYGYAMNVDVAGMNFAAFANPATEIALFDSTDLARNATEPISTLPKTPRYGTNNTIAYLDGHVP